MPQDITLSRKAFVLDDHQLFADSFTLLLERYMQFEEVQSFSKAEDLLACMAELGTKEVYVFLDYYLYNDNGLQVFSEIKRLNKKAYIIFITSAVSTSVIRNLILAKPHGILSKSSDVPTMMDVTNRVIKGEISIDQNLQEILSKFDDIPSFTPRELQLLKHFSLGSSISEVAEKMFLSKHTIVAHRRKMMAKADCKSIGQLIRFAHDNELI
ncbi:response regulator transcription factor [Sphingobacterium sp. lm-10]|uniref:response regulator n=1 Tax=Sphingobacterium sp. lm-10 TaxID=2944904 RepID=UPI002020C4B0|nr:response regulator transcription factor [Sphingobacterium sp. lm-10]MCL7986568.1 response regulator transcription factor [Sphingobacterium sp. lm-10]